MTEQPQAFVAFLFDADHASIEYNYGSPCEDALLEAIASVDKQRTLVATVRRGDILARNLARAVSHIAVPAVKPSARSWTGHQQTIGTDRRRLLTIIGDLADSFDGLWHSFDVREMPKRFAGTNVYCLSMFPVALDLAKQIDGKLQAFDPYLGALQIDPGNPVHIEVFYRLLTCVFFERGTMYASRWDTDEGVYEFGQVAARHFSVKDLPYWDFEQAAPGLPSSTMSTRGAESHRRLSTVTKPTIFERVADALLEHARRKDRAPIELSVLPPDEEQSHIPVAKLLNYALDVNHRDGRHKARLFSSLLGIHAEDWRYLAYQILERIVDSEFSRLRVTEHGVQFTALIQVVGLNGRTCTVETGWIARSTGPAQLLTAFPAVEEKQLNSAAAPPPWVPSDVRGSKRWQAIFESARETGSRAAMAHVPTPVQYVGFEVELEGESGAASIRLDGRTAFARWLVAQGHAAPSTGAGVVLYAVAPTQSVERAEAFAKAFGRVLWLNGIDAFKVKRHLSRQRLS